MKVNVGSSKLKKSFFPISFDSSTTTNFGECIPTFCQEVPQNTHVSLDLKQGVRFSPLSLPTFGKAFLQSYAFCHKICDLYPPFESLLSQTPYTSGSGSVYTPTHVPSVPLSLLWLIVLSHSSFSLVSFDPRLNLGSNDPILFSKYPYEVVDVSSMDDFNFQDFSNGLILNLVNSSFLAGTSIKDLFWNYLISSDRSDNLVCNKDSVISSFDPDTHFSPGESDYLVELTSSSFFYFLPNGSASNMSLSDLPAGHKYFLSIRLNNAGKFLRKIFMGLGYQICPFDKQVSILPLFAYFKSYFETFAPKRFIKYDQTYFGRLMAEIVSSGSDPVDLFVNTNYVSTLSGIIDDLLSCYYTKDTDYYSSQIIGMINDYGSNLKAGYVGVDEAGDASVDKIQTDLVSHPDAGPSIDFNVGGMQHTQAQQNILARLTEFVNRRSLLGGKVATLLESVFGIKPSTILDDNPYIGSSIVDVDFSDVFSTAETAEGNLGEYAGKAVGFGSSDNFHVETDVHSIVVCFSVVVPRTQYCQGVNPCHFHIGQYDFYNPQFDGLTLLPTDRLSFVAPNPIGYVPAYKTLSSFGNAPIYSEYKTRSQGILNGDLSLLSTKSSFDSFTMDQMFSDQIIDSTSDLPGQTDVPTIYAIKPNLQNIVSGTMWRYIGRWIWLGNFDRIFINNRITLDDYEKLLSLNSKGIFFRDVTRSDDNLVIHNIVDLKLNSAMLPLADSYMTKDMNDLYNGVGVTSQGE